MIGNIYDYPHGNIKILDTYNDCVHYEWEDGTPGIRTREEFEEWIKMGELILRYDLADYISQL